MNSLVRGAIAAIAFAAAAPASATIFEFEELDPQGASGAGEFDHVAGSFNDETNLLTWNTTWKKKDGKKPNGFWMVLSDGDNAKGHDNTYAVLYGSLSGGDKGKLSAYVYDGYNGPNSWTNRDFIGAFDNAITVENTHTTRNMSFAIDATAINAFGEGNGFANWFGTGFGERIGIWQHAFTGDVDFNNDGEVTKLVRYNKSWYDTGDQPTTSILVVAEVPEPAPLALIGLGLAIAAFAARARKA